MKRQEKRLEKHFRRMKIMGIAFLGCIVGAFLPIIGLIFQLVGGLLIPAILIYFLCVAMWEGKISRTSEAIRDAMEDE